MSRLDTSTVYFGGHSLGGIVLESYINGHAELAQVLHTMCARSYVSSQHNPVGLPLLPECYVSVFFAFLYLKWKHFVTVLRKFF